jgi:hypothetical protein
LLFRHWKFTVKVFWRFVNFWGFVLSPYQCQPKTHPFDLKVVWSDSFVPGYHWESLLWEKMFLLLSAYWKVDIKILVKLIHNLFVLATCCWHKSGFVQWNRWRISCQNRYCFPTVKEMGSFWSK